MNFKYFIRIKNIFFSLNKFDIENVRLKVNYIKCKLKSYHDKHIHTEILFSDQDMRIPCI